MVTKQEFRQKLDFLKKVPQYIWEVYFPNETIDKVLDDLFDAVKNTPLRCPKPPEIILKAEDLEILTGDEIGSIIAKLFLGTCKLNFPEKLIEISEKIDKN